MTDLPVRTGKQRAFEAVLDKLEQAISSGDLSAGDKLPPERDLALKFNASRPSVREALRVLEALGLVDVQRGPGHGITLRESPLSDSLEYLLRFHLALRHVGMKTIGDMLTNVSRWAIRDAIENSDPEVISELERIVTKMQDVTLSPDDFEELDVAFHMVIVHAARNELGTLMIESCRSTMARLIEAATVRASDWKAVRRRLAKEHLEIFLAVQGKDKDLAETLLADHLSTWIEQGIKDLERVPKVRLV